tara:strand:- start:119 stop:1267 length:1149 start_codon:yes stop_codon:yes gene_type:complete
LNDTVLAFIEEHQNRSTAELALLLSKKPQLPKEFILNQINGLQKAKQKLPFLLEFDSFIYPSARAFSQASSEQTGTYKATILSAKKVLDLSGGMGIDSYFFAQHVEEVTYVDMNEELVKTVRSNFENLKTNNVTCMHSKAEDFIERDSNRYDLIYLDPDRRSAKEKAFKIDDCEPNVAELLPHIWKKSKQCLIKLSPMLDIQQALTQLPFCKEVHVVSVENECKELLFLLQYGFEETPIIRCINLLKKNTQHFEFNFEHERSSSNTMAEVDRWLYEPNVSILKAGAFKSIGQQFGLTKLATNTHLYTSAELQRNFPGRIIRVLEVSKPKKGMIQKANVVCRNFSMKPEQLKKKYNIKDGGIQFLYACILEDGNKRFVLGDLV